MCEPGHYLFFIGFCLGMRYMGDDRIAFDFQGWFDRPDVTGKFIHDKIDEIIYILNQKYYIDCIVKYKQFKI